jgi:serine/threonine-protein kinase
VERIGRYEVEEEIGRGAMGVVYLARDPRVRRRLALKTYELPQGIAPEQAREYRERFVREAQSAGALSHPAIVTIYDVDEDPENGASYIAMEYVPGSSLRKLLGTLGRLEPERAILLGTTIAEALQVAHTAGIVHRDVKPDNILVREPDGAFKIADFGIARLHDSDLTQAGLTVGSPAYMSPEQIRSRDVDGRSDLFSLASVLYEALCGKRPFDGKDLPSLAYAVAHEDARPISHLAPSLPGSLDEFFAKALAKNPAERFQDGKSFALALHEAWARRVTSAQRPGAAAEASGRRQAEETPRQDGGAPQEITGDRQATSADEQTGPGTGPEISGNSRRPASDSWMTVSDDQKAKSAPQGGGDGQERDTDSQPRAYRPQCPEEVLRRAQEERRPGRPGADPPRPRSSSAGGATRPSHPALTRRNPDSDGSVTGGRPAS